MCVGSFKTIPGLILKKNVWSSSGVTDWFILFSRWPSDYISPVIKCIIAISKLQYVVPENTHTPLKMDLLA